MRGVIYGYQINNKYYIGKTYMEERKRKAKHKFEALSKGSENPFARAIIKYGWEEVEKSYFIIEEVFAETKQELNGLLIEKEEKYIIEYNSLIPNGYNVRKNGQYSIPHTYNKDEIYSRVSKSLKGKHLNCKETSRSVTCVETNITYPSVSEASRMTGVNLSSIQKCATGKTCKAGGLTWIYDGEKPRESKTKMHRILCVETGVEYDGIRNASRSIAGNKNGHCNIQRALRTGGTAYGYHWKKLDKTISCFQTKNQFGSVTTIPLGGESPQQE